MFAAMLRRLRDRAHLLGWVRRDKLYIFPTKFGWLFLLTLLGMLWGSSNYTNSLGFILTFLLGGAVFVSMFHTHAMLKNVRPVSFKVEPVFAGQAAVFDIGVRTEGRPRYAVEFQLDDAEPVTADLLPDRENRVRPAMAAEQRGLLRPRRGVCVSTVWPFGLFRAWTWPDFPVQCVVYPAPAEGETDLAFARTGAGGEGQTSGPGVDDFDEIRQYRHGDSPQRIAWKASFRGYGLMTKQFQGLYGASALLDWEQLPAADPEDKLSLLCAMVLKADAENMSYGLKLPGLLIEPDTGEQHKRKCLEALALFEAAP